MKEVTCFIADDGTLFEERSGCLDYEALCFQLEGLRVRYLRDRPTSFEEGQCIQQESESVLAYQREVIRLALQYGVLPTDNANVEFGLIANRPVGLSLIGRYLDEGGNRALNKAWWRLMCMDRQFREYEQPYHAIQADKEVP